MWVLLQFISGSIQKNPVSPDSVSALIYEKFFFILKTQHIDVKGLV